MSDEKQQAGAQELFDSVAYHKAEQQKMLDKQFEALYGSADDIDEEVDARKVQAALQQAHGTNSADEQEEIDLEVNSENEEQEEDTDTQNNEQELSPEAKLRKEFEEYKAQEQERLAAKQKEVDDHKAAVDKLNNEILAEKELAESNKTRQEKLKERSAKIRELNIAIENARLEAASPEELADLQEKLFLEQSNVNFDAEERSNWKKEAEKAAEAKISQLYASQEQQRLEKIEKAFIAKNGAELKANKYLDAIFRMEIQELQKEVGESITPDELLSKSFENAKKVLNKDTSTQNAASKNTDEEARIAAENKAKQKRAAAKPNASGGTPKVNKEEVEETDLEMWKKASLSKHSITGYSGFKF